MLKKIILSVIVILVVAWLFYGFEINSPASSNGQDVSFVVDKGLSVKQISTKLEQAGIIRSKSFFNYYVWLKDKQADIKAGEYILNPSMNLKKIVQVLTGGETTNSEKTITIIEGWSIADIDNYFTKNNIFTDNNFAALAKTKTGDWKLKTPKPDFLQDAPAGASLEGFLFPDTYRIFNDATAEDAIGKMLDNFDSKLTGQMRQDIAKQNKTIYEIIIMASIIEKEVRTPEDMKIVSGIFWDRIKNGQALESCATLAYILGEKKAQYSYEDTRIDSPYNTYRNRGLTPGPICNPGLNAITAAIYPKYTEYNYFLSRLDTGETVYSRTLDEHNINKAKYLK